MKKPSVSLLSTRDQVVAQGLFSLKPYSVVSDVYHAMNRGSLDNIHIPHSDVYFVRAALEKQTGFYFPLDAVENAMKAEGWKDRKGNRYG
jgi:hypothetical protein